MGGPRTAADNGSAGTQTRHTAGARPEHGALPRREYVLLALTGTGVDPSDLGTLKERTLMRPQGGRLTTPGERWRETEEGDKTR